ncbi:MAG TPA: hypothetical protein VK811_00265 [Candidatus Acidoferrum sp.]|nr:hypothetical protein [Candidatus Acidoferrum sp.]
MISFVPCGTLLFLYVLYPALKCWAIFFGLQVVANLCHFNCAMRPCAVPLRRFWHSELSPHAGDYLMISLYFDGFKDFLACGIPAA